MPGHKVDINNPLPRYYQVYVSLEERIRSGEFSPGDALPSERHLAVDYGVSRITVVKSLDMLEADDLIERQHGRGNFVLGQPDAEMCGENCRVAFCVPSPSEAYIFSTLRGATRAAMHNHIQLQVVEIGSGEEEAESIEQLRSQGFEGLVLFSPSAQENRDLYRNLLTQQYPFVMIDRYCPDAYPDVAVFDDELAGYELTKILIQQGHRRIALLTGREEQATSVQDRLRGYRRALEEHGIAYEEKLVDDEMDDILGISANELDQLKTEYVAFLDWIHNEGPTAIVAVNNYLAERADAILTKVQMALMQAVIDARAQGVDYQLKIALTSVTHRPLLLGLTPLVALAWQSGETLGETAMALLVERLRREAPPPPRIVKVPMKIREMIAESQ